MTNHASRFLLMVALGAVLFSGCAAGPAAPRQEGATTDSVSRATAPKTLRMGTNRESVDGLVVFAGNGEPAAQQMWMFHAGLTTYDPQGNLLPRVAQKVPSIEDGDWKLLPDGGMELTWKLRPNVKWHDGTPLHAEDFVLGIQVARDPDLPLPHTGGVRLVKEVLAPDASTLVVRWSEPYYGANEGAPAEMPALPRHLLADLYRQGDKQAFINSTYWASEYIGLGPYRLGEWVQGSHLEALAFDDYFLGRPKIDKVIVRFILDANTTVANLLSGDLDLVAIGTLKAEELTPVQSAWAASGDGTIIESMTYVTYGRWQFRDPNAPWARDVRVRQALMHIIDRQELADTFYPGRSGPVDLFAAKEDPVYRLAEQRGFRKYPYSITDAERLLAEAGWTRGPDRKFQNSAGERFNIEVRVVANTPSNVQQGLALVDQWQRGGMESEIFSIAGSATNKPELKASNKGVFVQPDPMEPAFMEGFISAQMQTPENKWQGRNLSGYLNPDFDRLYAQYVNTLELGKRREVYADVLKRGADEVMFLPLYYSSGSNTAAFRRGLRGPGQVLPNQVVTTWNIHEWEMN
jgi:peptide/nickel transport system substrate-binding protein